MPTPVPNSGEDAVDPRVDLAIKRTELAWDRTILAWIRTTIALMGAGVAFDKGTELLHQARVLAGTALVQSSHAVGLALTGLSTVLLISVSLQYLRDQRTLARIKGSPASFVTPALLAAIFTILLGCGVFLFLSRQKS